MKTFYFILFIAAVLFLELPAQNNTVENSIIIFIHGDGDYLFHGTDGKAFLADEAALNKSVKAASQLTNSEVFIFHYKKKSSSFLLFSNEDVNYYFYRNGELIKKVSLYRSGFNFDDEINFYRQLASPCMKRLMLYYGHEIPFHGGDGYNSSYKNEQFNISIFSDVLNRFSANQKYDLLVLSTCGNGSPEVIKQLSASADYIIASPDDLHLSYMNPLNLKMLNLYRGYNFEEFVVEFARSSFRELKNSVETVSVIAAYKTDKLSQNFLKDAGQDVRLSVSSLPAENCDCADTGNFDEDEAAKGVIVFYNPPSFGKWEFKLEHSGWGCKRRVEYNISPAVGSMDM